MSYRRYSYVAGTFYESDRDALIKQIERCFLHDLGPQTLPKVSDTRSRESLGFIVPHAGYMYSGPVAAHAYYRIGLEGKPRAFVIIGPNHTGLGSPIAIMDRGIWVTPLGEVYVDEEVAKIIIRNSSYLDVSIEAFEYEHSIEVQLPFLQYLFKDVRFVPIVMGLQLRDVARDIADALRRVLDQGIDVVIIATSDWTHYEPYDIAIEKDRIAIEKVLEVNPEGLYKVVEEHSITACGVGPVATLLYLARFLGIARGELLKYATSGDIVPIKDRVVGYASIRIPYSTQS